MLSAILEYSWACFTMLVVIFKFDVSHYKHDVTAVCWLRGKCPRSPCCSSKEPLLKVLTELAQVAVKTATPTPQEVSIFSRLLFAGGCEF